MSVDRPETTSLDDDSALSDDGRPKSEVNQVNPTLKYCLYCGDPLPFNKQKVQRGKTCGKPECKRERNREAAREYRQREKRKDSAAVQPDGSVHTPFGTFPDQAAAEHYACRQDTQDAINGIDTCPADYAAELRPAGKRENWRQFWLQDNGVSSDLDPADWFDAFMETQKQ